MSAVAPIGVMVTAEIEEARVPAFLEACGRAGSRRRKLLEIRSPQGPESEHVALLRDLQNDEAMAVRRCPTTRPGPTSLVLRRP